MSSNSNEKKVVVNVNSNKESFIRKPETLISVGNGMDVITEKIVLLQIHSLLVEGFPLVDFDTGMALKVNGKILVWKEGKVYCDRKRIFLTSNKKDSIKLGNSEYLPSGDFVSPVIKDDEILNFKDDNGTFRVAVVKKKAVFEFSETSLKKMLALDSSNWAHYKRGIAETIAKKGQFVIVDPNNPENMTVERVFDKFEFRDGKLLIKPSEYFEEAIVAFTPESGFAIQHVELFTKVLRRKREFDFLDALSRYSSGKYSKTFTILQIEFLLKIRNERGEYEKKSYDGNPALILKRVLTPTIQNIVSNEEFDKYIRFEKGEEGDLGFTPIREGRKTVAVKFHFTWLQREKYEVEKQINYVKPSTRQSGIQRILANQKELMRHFPDPLEREAILREQIILITDVLEIDELPNMDEKVIKGFRKLRNDCEVEICALEKSFIDSANDGKSEDEMIEDLLSNISLE